MWVVVMVMLLAGSSGVFFAQLGKTPLNFDTLTYDDVSKGRAVQGECYIVYDIISYGYTEETNKYTGKTTTTTNDYFWVVDCGEEDLLLVRTSANDVLSDNMQSLVDVYWDSETLEDFKANYPGPVRLDGFFVNNDHEVVDFYSEWATQIKAADSSFQGARLAPYTLDCVRSYEDELKFFYAGSAMLVVTIVVGAAFLVYYRKKSRESSAAQFAGTPAVSYGSMNGGSYGDPKYGSTDGTYHSQNSSAYGTFQSQSGTSYGTSGGTYQSQGGTGYGTSGSTFQSQSGTSYGTSGGTYQSQSGSTYGTSGGAYQPQSGSTYGTSGSTYQSSQSGINYGSSSGMYGSQGSTTFGTQGSSYGTQNGGDNQ